MPSIVFGQCSMRVADRCAESADAPNIVFGQGSRRVAAAGGAIAETDGNEMGKE